MLPPMPAGMFQQNKGCQMRRRTRRKIWMTFLSMVTCVFLLENALWIMAPQHPGDQSDAMQRITFQVEDTPTNVKQTHMKVKRVINHEDHPKKFQRTKEISDTRQISEEKKVTSRRLSDVPRGGWIVVNSRQGCDVTHLASIPGWKVVVTGKPAKNCKSPTCVYLDEKREKKFGFQITNLLQKNSESWKMIGYLFAITKKANIIYDVDCHVVPKFNRVGFSFSGNTSGLAFTGPTFNPYGHFGYPMLTPRGLPANIKVQGHFRIVDLEAPLIQQGQVNFVLGKRDVPTLKLSRDMNITFDRSSPPVFLSGTSYAPINSRNTVFLAKAFWALFLPSTSKSDGDIVRGYLAQRLLAEIGGTVGFLPPTAYSLKSGETKFISKQTNNLIPKLLTSLKSWKCVSKLSFFSCAKSIIGYLVKLDFLVKKDIKIFNAWVVDLKKAGYKEPVRVFNKIESRSNLTNPEVIYSSPKNIPTDILFQKNSQSQAGISKNVFQNLHKVCPQQKQTLSMWINPPITDIMLVVIFNYEFLFKNLPYMEYTQRMYFRHILYCGPSFAGFEKIQKRTNMQHLIYVNGVDKDTWFFTYQCLVHAADMNSNVKGYLYIGDDILLNTWNIVDLPRDQFWMPKPMTTMDRSEAEHPWWYYWKKPVGRTAANGFINDLKQIAKRNPNDEMVTKFLSTYDRNIKLSNVVHRSIDAFYAPAKYNAEIIRFGRLFRKHKTLLGLAVPMLHVGLVDLKDVIQLKGKSLWKDKRSNYIEAFNENNHYLHPFKAGKDLDTKAGRQFFCDTYMVLSTKKLEHIRTRRHKSRRKL